MLCSGRHDERVLNAAIARLKHGGTIRLADGDYSIDGFEQEGNSAVCFGYNDGSARTITFTGTTENKSYNTRHGVTIHVTKSAMAKMSADKTYRVFYGTARRPKAEGDFYTMTHVNNVNFSNFYLFFHDASKPLRGIDGSNFGQMYVDLVGVYADGEAVLTLDEGKSVEIARSAKTAKLIELEGYDPYDVLARKLGWSGSNVK